MSGTGTGPAALPLLLGEQATSVLAALPVGVIVTDDEGRILQANSLAEQIWGGVIPRDGGIAGYVRFQGWWVDSGRRLEPQEWAAARALKDGARSTSEAIDIVRFDGSRGTILNSAAPIRDAEGRLIGAIVVLLDVTARLGETRALRASHEALALIFESSPNVLLMLDEAKCITLVNQQVRKVFGFEPSELVGQPLKTLIPSPPGELPREAVGRHKDGHEIPLEIGLAPVTTDKGRFVVATLVDLTLRKQAEQNLLNYQTELEAQVRERSAAIQEANAFLNSVVENIPDMIFIKDARDLRFVRFNRAGEELLGYSRDQMIGKSDYDFFPKEEADVFTNEDREVLAGIRGGELPEEVISTRGRGQRVLHTKKMAILDQQGRPQYLLGISEDITERKQAEEMRLQLLREQARAEESQREKRRWRFLAHASQVLATSLDYETTAKHLADLAVADFADWCVVSDQALKPVAMAAKDKAQLEQARTFLQAHPIDVAGNMPAAQVLRTGKPMLMSTVSDVDLQAIGQSPLFIEALKDLGFTSAIIAPLIVRKEIVGTVTLTRTQAGSSFDQSDLELAEEFAHRASTALDNAQLYAEAQKAIQLREDFMAIASHELKTPLTPLKLQLQMLARMLRRHEGTSREQDLLKLVGASDKHIVRLTRLVDDLLEVSRLGAVQMRLSPEPVDLSVIARDVVDRLASELATAGCTLELEVSDGVVGLWDRMRVDQIVVNLLTNAMKYGSGRPIRIAVSSNGHHGILTVQDRGIGIAEDDQRRIFGRFERAVPVKSFGGMGLGLYIAALSAEAHGGHISVKSALGKGSTFTVELPLRGPSQSA